MTDQTPHTSGEEFAVEATTTEPAQHIDTAASTRGGRRRGLIVGSLCVVAATAIGVVVTLLQAQAGDRHDVAHDEARSAVDVAVESQGRLHNVIELSGYRAEAATRILTAVADGRADADAATALQLAADELTASITTAGSAADADVPTLQGTRPFWWWELDAAREQLDDNRATADAVADAADAGAETLNDAMVALDDRADAVGSTVAAAATAIEQANISSRTVPVLALRDAAAAVLTRVGVTDATATVYEHYASAARNVVASHAAELAEKAGPLFDTRVEIETYARSISGGVLLEFDWAPLVSGLGGADWYSGTATWDATRTPGTSLITLSDSIAERWWDESAKAVVTHEVGHAITAKCWEMFDWADGDAN